MSITEIIGILGCVIFGTWVIYTLRKVYYDFKRERMVKNFEAYMKILDFNLEKAYDMLYKDKILIYSLEATTLPDKEFNQYSRDFLRLAQKIMGPSLVAEFVIFYGNYETFAFNMAEFFNTKYENDEIRQTSIDNLQESELEV